MSEIRMEPKEYEAQVSTCEEAAEEVAAVHYEAEAKKAKLDSLSLFLDCVERYSRLIDQFSVLLSKDIATMRQIKSTWMNADSQLANKTFSEIIKG